MPVRTSVTRPFGELSRADVRVAGGKGANLGELTAAGLPVPPGFVLTADAYLASMAAGGVRDRLRDRLRDDLPGCTDPVRLAQLSADLQQTVRRAGLAPEVRDELLSSYAALGGFVAVRSSATSEDAGDTSFAGMNLTRTNVAEHQLGAAVLDCWASLFGQRVLAYRQGRGAFDEAAMAVVVQRMVDADCAGVAFTADPSTSDRSRVVVEAARGLGEVVVSGTVEPDTYVLSKVGPRIVQLRVGHQDHKLVRGPDGHDLRVELSPEDADARVLDDDEVLDLARLALRVEEHYGAPQDLEWARAGAATFLVQSRPITTLLAPEADGVDGAGRVLVRGLAASSGVASGRVRLLASPSDGARLRDGEVLVTTMTSPDWVPTSAARRRWSPTAAA